MRFYQRSVNRQRVLLYSQRFACAMAMLLVVCPHILQAAPVVTFTNNSGVIITDPGPAIPEEAKLTKGNPYPSTITVSGFDPAGSILDVNVVLNNVTHEYVDDLDLLLVGPTGAMVLLVSNVSGLDAGTSVSGLNWHIDDAANRPLRNSNNNTGISGGVLVPEWFEIWTDTSLRPYRPSDYDGGLGDFDNGDDPLGDFFDLNLPGLPSAPALVDFDTPLGLSVFNGTSPNGVWSLYVADDYAGFGGSLGSWSLEITATPEPTSIALMLGGVAVLGVARWKRGSLRSRQSED